MLVFVNALHGPLVIDLEPSDTVHDFKWKIYVKTGLLPTQQVWSFGGKQPEDVQKLSDYIRLSPLEPWLLPRRDDDEVESPLAATSDGSATDV